MVNFERQAFWTRIYSQEGELLPVDVGFDAAKSAEPGLTGLGIINTFTSESQFGLQMHMAPEQKQQQLVAKLSLIEDRQERLAWVVDRARKIPPLSEPEKTEENRVQGCVSRVWLVGNVEDGHCRFRLDADSTLVKGLAWLLCEVADGATPAEIASFEPRVLDELHLADQLSPTRRNGLEQVQRRIREFALTQIAS